MMTLAWPRSTHMPIFCRIFYMRVLRACCWEGAPMSPYINVKLARMCMHGSRGCHDVDMYVVVKGELAASQSGPPSPGKVLAYWEETEWAEWKKELQDTWSSWATNFRSVVTLTLDGEVLMSEDQLMATRRAITDELELMLTTHGIKDVAGDSEPTPSSSTRAKVVGPRAKVDRATAMKMKMSRRRRRGRKAR
jgi:hypothetical protein